MNSASMELAIGELSSSTYLLAFDNWAGSGFELDGTERTIKLTYEGPFGDPGEIWEVPETNPDWVRGYNKLASSVNVSTVRFYFKFDFDNV